MERADTSVHLQKGIFHKTLSASIIKSQERETAGCLAVHDMLQSKKPVESSSGRLISVTPD